MKSVVRKTHKYSLSLLYEKLNTIWFWKISFSNIQTWMRWKVSANGDRGVLWMHCWLTYGTFNIYWWRRCRCIRNNKYNSFSKFVCAFIRKNKQIHLSLLTRHVGPVNVIYIYELHCLCMRAIFVTGKSENGHHHSRSCECGKFAIIELGSETWLANNNGHARRWERERDRERRKRDDGTICVLFFNRAYKNAEKQFIISSYTISFNIVM